MMTPNVSPSPTATLHESQGPSLEEFLSDLAENLPKKLPFPFSGVIAFQVGGGFTEACHSPGQPQITTDQPFNILSIGKLFTATAVMQLTEEGVFSLNTLLGELLTGEELELSLYPPYDEGKPNAESLEQLKTHADKIKVGDLLSHVAGFNKGSWNEKQIGNYHYSNYGYQLLAKIIGKYTCCCDPSVTNHEVRFLHHINGRIFTPAGMETASRECFRPTRPRPKRYEVSLGGDLTEVTSPEPYPHGSGGFRMTAKDLLEFNRAIQENRLMTDASFRILRDHQGKGHLGYWVDRNPNTGAVVGYGHPANSGGMSSVLHTWETNPPITVAVLSNYSGCHNVKSALEAYFHVASVMQTFASLVPSQELHLLKDFLNFLNQSAGKR